MIEFVFFISSITFFMLIFAAVFHTIFRRQIVIDQRVDVYFGGQITADKKVKKVRKVQSTAFRSFWNNSVHLVNKRVNSKNQQKLAIMLRDAGYTKLSPAEFRLFQLLVSSGLGFATFILFTPLSDKPFFSWVLSLTVAFLGYRILIFQLAKKKTARVKQINKDMADFFDMVNLLLNAGVGLEGAIANVCSKTNGPLSEEFKVTLEDMKRGKSRREAFYELKMRVPSDSFQSVIMSIIQADHLGIGMARVIKNLTTRIREQRRESAREQAMKAPVKMLIPMIMFIFPSLFIVILGPMVVKLVTDGLG